MATNSEAPSARRILGASLVGTAVEFYDFYIYATAASLVFGPLFFPAASPAMQLLSSYATMAVELVEARNFGRFCAVQGGRYVALSADTPLKGERRVDVGSMYDVEAIRPRVRGVAGRSMFFT